MVAAGDFPPLSELRKASNSEGNIEGIQFVTNDRGQKTAVMIDLHKYGEIWEDFYDDLIASLRADEPRETLASIKDRLCKQGKLGGKVRHHLCSLCAKGIQRESK